MTFFGALRNYLNSNTVIEILKVKLGNIFYPLMVQDGAVCLDNGFAVFRLASCGAHLSFFQLVFAIGIPGMILVIWQLIKNKIVGEVVIWLASGKTGVGTTCALGSLQALSWSALESRRGWDLHLRARLL